MQLAEKQDAASAREKLMHHTAEMITTKQKAKIYDNNYHTFLLNMSWLNGYKKEYIFLKNK
jgi:hypothetical protein